MALGGKIGKRHTGREEGKRGPQNQAAVERFPEESDVSYLYIPGALETFFLVRRSSLLFCLACPSFPSEEDTRMQGMEKHP